MNKEVIRKILRVFSVILFGVMTATLGYNYAYMECAIAHQGASAPAYIAFFIGIPFIVLIAICLVIIKVLKEKN